MTALDRALALVQRDHVAPLVGHDLNLDVPGLLDVLLDIEVGNAEGRGGLGLGGPEGGDEILGFADDAHAPTAAARGSLDDDRKTDLFGETHRLLFVLENPGRAGNHGHTRLDHGLFGPTLVPHQADGLGRGADESDPAGFADLGKVGRLGEESVPGMNGVSARDLRRRNDGGHAQVGILRAGGADADGLIGELHVQRVAVGLGIDSDRLQAQLFAGPDDAQGDLPAVGDQNFFEHLGESGTRWSGRGDFAWTREDPAQAVLIVKSGSPNWTGCPFSGWILRTSPATSDSISFMSFMASTMQRT